MQRTVLIATFTLLASMGWITESQAGIVGRGIVKYGNHCGPGHENPGKRAVDAVDAMCKEHDRCCAGKQIYKHGLVYCPCSCDKALLTRATQLKRTKLKTRARLVLASIYRIFRLHRCSCPARRRCHWKSSCRRQNICRKERKHDCRTRLQCKKAKVCRKVLGKERCVTLPKCKRVKQCKWLSRRSCKQRKICNKRKICKTERPIKGRSGRCSG